MYVFTIHYLDPAGDKHTMYMQSDTAREAREKAMANARVHIIKKIKKGERVQNA